VNLLVGTPFNTVVVEGTDVEVQTLFDRASKQGLNVLRKTAAGYVVLPEGAQVFPETVASRVAGDHPAPVVVITKALWPRVPAFDPESRKNSVATGPTGSPWVESNGWLSTLARAKAPAKTFWISTVAPKGLAMRPESYELAVADAAAYGTRPLMQLESGFQEKLAAKDADAKKTFTRLADTVRFFEARRAWNKYSPASKLVVCSDFSGPNEAIASEVLNLCNRRHLPYRVVPTSLATSASLEGAEAVLLVEMKPPEQSIQQLMGRFLMSGGLVIAPASQASLTSSLTPAGNFDNRYDLFRHGEGKVAVARKPWNDPYTLAVDTHLLMSRRADVIRLWNAGATNAFYTRGGNGSGLVQILNYTARVSGQPMSLYVASPYKKAWSTSLNGAERVPLSINARGEGVEVALPPFPVYTAVEFGD
jgi:hypothetical protein